MKYRPEFPERFGAIEVAGLVPGLLPDVQDRASPHSGIGLLTPYDVHHGVTHQRVTVRFD